VGVQVEVQKPISIVYEDIQIDNATCAGRALRLLLAHASILQESY
jgi:hypothetical protein